MSLAVQQPSALPANQPSETAAIVSMIERLASDPNVDVDRLMKILELRDRVEARNAKLEFDRAMSDAQAAIEPIVKAARNDQTRSNYARLEDVNAGLMPVITSRGFSVSFGMAEGAPEGHYRITMDLAHVGGHRERKFADIPTDRAGLKGNDNKTLTHAFGSTISYGRRYILLMAFNISTFDDVDGNRQRREPERVERQSVQAITPEQAQRIRALLAEVGRTEAQLLARVKGFASIDDIPADIFDTVCNFIAGAKQ